MFHKAKEDISFKEKLFCHKIQFQNCIIILEDKGYNTTFENILPY